MSLPGFTAIASLSKSTQSYRARISRTVPAMPATAISLSLTQQATPTRANKIISQLSLNPFPISTGAGLFGGLFCRLRCEMAYSDCLDTCEGTLDNPKPSMNCVICDQQHTECLKGCGATLF